MNHAGGCRSTKGSLRILSFFLSFRFFFLCVVPGISCDYSTRTWYNSYSAPKVCSTATIDLHVTIAPCEPCRTEPDFEAVIPLFSNASIGLPRIFWRLWQQLITHNQEPNIFLSAPTDQLWPPLLSSVLLCSFVLSRGERGLPGQGGVNRGFAPSAGSDPDP